MCRLKLQQAQHRYLRTTTARPAGAEPLQHGSGRWPARSAPHLFLMRRQCFHRLRKANARHNLRTIGPTCRENSLRNPQERCMDPHKLPLACKQCQTPRPIDGGKGQRNRADTGCKATKRGTCLTTAPLQRRTKLRTLERHRCTARGNPNLARTYLRPRTQIDPGTTDRNLGRTTRAHDAFLGPQCGPRAERREPSVCPAAA